MIEVMKTTTHIPRSVPVTAMICPVEVAGVMSP